jgi:hypothetical protein
VRDNDDRADDRIDRVGDSARIVGEVQAGGVKCVHGRQVDALDAPSARFEDFGERPPRPGTVPGSMHE